MKDFYLELLEYTYKMNQILADAFGQNADKIPEKAISLFSHVLNAHNIWNNRINQQLSSFGVSDVHSINLFSQINKKNHENSILIVKENDLADIIEYSNSRGDIFHNKITDILFHIVNHSTYHRAQIATEFKINGLEPLLTDYIFYKR